MKTQRILVMGLALVAAVVVIWVVRQRFAGSPIRPEPLPGTVIDRTGQPPTAAFPKLPPAVVKPEPYRPVSEKVAVDPQWGSDAAKMRAEVEAIVAELKALYGFVGELSHDAAKKLMAERRAKEEALMKRLAAMGPGGARVIQEVMNKGVDARTQLMMARALGLIDDGAASQVLGELLDRGGSMSLQEQLVVSLGQRFEDEVATQALTTRLSKAETDAALRYKMAQALSGRTVAVPTLVSTISTDADSKVRLEAIRALGWTGSAEGQEALLAVARDTSQELIVRQTAIQELRRSYGTGAWDMLLALREDEDAEIRKNAERALTMLMGKPVEGGVELTPSQ